jgi:hypothetical protein
VVGVKPVNAWDPTVLSGYLDHTIIIIV